MLPAIRPSRILVVAPERELLDETCALLTAQKHTAAARLLQESPPDDLAKCQLVIVETTSQHSGGLAWCRRFRQVLNDTFIPVLVITSDHSPAVRLGAFEAGADAYMLRPFLPEELHAQVEALLRIKEMHDRLNEKTAEVNRINKRLQDAYAQIDQELELAHRLQLSFLPHQLPEIPPARFAVHFLLCGQVGGDFYDVFRLDENHIGFYVADAMGHGVPASLLTIFVKKGVRGKEVFGRQYRLLSPREVLEQLNRELIDQELSDMHFITMVYVLFNHRDGTFRFSRAGHPYPLLVPKEGELQLLEQEGLLLGVLDASFSDGTQMLHPGDKVLLYSDGIDAAVFDGREPGIESLMACAAKHRNLPVKSFVEQVARDLFGEKPAGDDLTLLALEMCGES